MQLVRLSVVLLIPGASLAISQTQDVSETFQNVADKYRAIQDYTIDVKMARSGQSIGGDPKGIGMGLPPATSFPAWNKITIARHGGAFRYEVHAANPGRC